VGASISDELYAAARGNKTAMRPFANCCMLE